MSLRLRASAALLWRNDISALDQAVETLLNPPVVIEKTLLASLAASVEGISDPKAIPLLIRLTRSGEARVRRAATSALRHTLVEAAINPLLQQLSDPDRDTRYQAVLGLAEITGQYEWGPSIDLFQRDEQGYLAHWRQWGKTR